MRNLRGAVLRDYLNAPQIAHDGFSGQILRALRYMNITGASLFPGIDGVGRAVDEAVRIRIGESRRN